MPLEASIASKCDKLSVAAPLERYLTSIKPAPEHRCRFIIIEKVSSPFRNPCHPRHCKRGDRSEAVPEGRRMPSGSKSI